MLIVNLYAENKSFVDDAAQILAEAITDNNLICEIVDADIPINPIKNAGKFESYMDKIVSAIRRINENVVQVAIVKSPLFNLCLLNEIEEDGNRYDDLARRATREWKDVIHYFITGSSVYTDEENIMDHILEMLVGDNVIFHATHCATGLQWVAEDALFVANEIVEEGVGSVN